MRTTITVQKISRERYLVNNYSVQVVDGSIVNLTELNHDEETALRMFLENEKRNLKIQQSCVSVN